MGPFLRGHLLLFDRREGPGYSSATGLRLLVIFVLLELVLGPRVPALAWLGVAPPAWLRVTVLLALSLLAARAWAKASWRDLGFQPWREWTLTEKLYFAQVVVLANALFIAVYWRSLGGLRDDAGAWPAAAAIVVVEFLWGFYQELNYRGILQSELTRRFGHAAGVIAANVAFTFGPLHFYHFLSGRPLASTAMVLAATFAIGLLFAVIFDRTRNLWLVGIFHGIGNAYINGAPQIASQV